VKKKEQWKMIRFFMKCFLFTTVLLIGVILGMQLANDGMKKMKGYDDPRFAGAFLISQTDKGEVEASVLGEKVTNLEEKQKKLEEMEAFNLLSSIGKKLAQGMQSLFQQLFQGIAIIFEKILNE
jgi:hypothetical protein